MVGNEQEVKKIGEDQAISGLIGERNSRKDYLQALDSFDTALCELQAILQAAAGRIAPPHHGYSTHVLTQVAAAATSMICAAPLSRWARTDFQNWAFSCVAGYSRAIIEGHILTSYLIETPVSRDAWSAKLNVMHLNDCTRRIKYFKLTENEENVTFFQKEAEVLKGKLRNNEYFKTLEDKVQGLCLSGDTPMITDRFEMLDKLGWDRKIFRALYDLLSQHAHILPMSFYRIEPNGRGTGVENPTDRGYIMMMLETCAAALSDCTDKLVAAFPDTGPRRQGKKSRFTHGPIGNRPR